MLTYDYGIKWITWFIEKWQWMVSIMIFYNLLLWHDDEWYEFNEWHELWLWYEVNHMIYYLWNDNEWYDYDIL